MSKTYIEPEIFGRDEGTKKELTFKVNSALTRLNSTAFEALKLKSPNVPENAIPKPRYRDKTANDLTRSIIKWLELNGHQAERISVEGRILDTRKIITDGIGRRKIIGSVTRIKSSARIGSADISATIRGRSVKIEVKIGNDRQSNGQSEYQKEVETAGGIYLITKTFQQFYDWYYQFGKEAAGE
ncbi:hypothetical protein [Dyadobacter crusticola]|uniref:hypothetical protein n=1 Tax=Dyadobacter crusticola TaxID=292407 RepID=UPI0004E1C188|nr:hypothetical protein [Dyadobacter crusticola]